MSAPLRLQAAKLSFAFSDAAPIVEGASFSLPPGFAGLVGDNGAGKSTLLRLLAGQLSPSSGHVSVEPQGARVALCEQEARCASAAMRELAERSDRHAQRLRAALQLACIEGFEQQSAGERKRWQIGAALGAEPDLLLLDEPTNHLDARGRQWLSRALRGFRGVCVIVSHDRAFLNELTAHTLRVHRGRVQLYAGAYDAARAQWQAEREARLAEHAARKAEVARAARVLHDAHEAQRGAERQRSARVRMRNPHDADARTLGARTRVDWAEARHGRGAQLARRALDSARERLGEVAIERERGAALTVRAQAASRGFIAVRPEGELRAGERGPVLLHAPALHVRRGDRIWLRGDNGAGKSTLLAELLAHARVPRDDLLVLPQELSAHDTERDLAQVRNALPAERGAILSIVAALGVDPARLLASRKPSPGEARKLRIALGLGREASALVLDEPENHLDLPSIERLEDALCAYPGALVLVTHDAVLAARCAQLQWRIEDGTLRQAPLDAAAQPENAARGSA